jgi:hypothetical protein
MRTPQKTQKCENNIPNKPRNIDKKHSSDPLQQRVPKEKKRGKKKKKKNEPGRPHKSPLEASPIRGHKKNGPGCPAMFRISSQKSIPLGENALPKGISKNIEI